METIIKNEKFVLSHALLKYRRFLSQLLHSIAHLPSKLFFHPLGNFNRWAGEKFIGRANAGRVARAMRVIRVVCAVTTIGVAIALFATGAITFTGGLAIPIWAAAVAGAAMVMNMLAIGIGMMANHMKIEESYDREHELVTATNRLLSEDQEQLTIPHGMGQYWRLDRRLFWMNLGRRVHDFNGIAGTVVSLVGAGIAVAALIPGAQIPLAITTTVAVSLFIVSRLSSSLSAFFANLTNSHRLWAYKKVISNNIDRYIEISSNRQPNKANAANAIVDTIFTELNMDKSQSRYNRLIHFYCYKALFSFPGQAIAITASQQAQIKSLVGSLVVEKRGRGLATRQKLKVIDADHEFHVRRKGYKDKVSALDAMPILEKKVQAILLADAPDPLADMEVNHSYNDTHKCLRFTATMAQRENPEAKIAERLQTYVDPNGKLNTRALAAKYPLQGHPHRSTFFSGFHLPLLQQELAADNLAMDRLRLM